MRPDDLIGLEGTLQFAAGADGVSLHRRRAPFSALSVASSGMALSSGAISVSAFFRSCRARSPRTNSNARLSARRLVSNGFAGKFHPGLCVAGDEVQP